MVPNGALVELEGGPSIARLDQENSPWPDSLSSELLRIKGYDLNRDRRPTFKYVFGEIAVEDQVVPQMNGKALTRTIRYNHPQKTPGVWARIIAAETIENSGDGVYLINEGQFYIKMPDTNQQKAHLRATSSGEELLVPFSTSQENGEIKYSIIW